MPTFNISSSPHKDTSTCTTSLHSSLVSDLPNTIPAPLPIAISAHTPTTRDVLAATQSQLEYELRCNIDLARDNYSLRQQLADRNREGANLLARAQAREVEFYEFLKNQSEELERVKVELEEMRKRADRAEAEAESLNEVAKGGSDMMQDRDDELEVLREDLVMLHKMKFVVKY